MIYTNIIHINDICATLIFLFPNKKNFQPIIAKNFNFPPTYEEGNVIYYFSYPILESKILLYPTQYYFQFFFFTNNRGIASIHLEVVN